MHHRRKAADANRAGKLSAAEFAQELFFERIFAATVTNETWAASENDHNSEGGLVAKNSGFSLHAGVTVAGSDRKKLEKLCRYIARPAIALDRLKVNDKGQVVYSLKKPYSDGTTHIVMQPLELLEKIAAIIPRPKIHLTRFHGILAPHDKHRKLIVPKLPPVAEVNPEASTEPTSKAPITWAKLLKRVFDIDVETCAECGGKTKITDESSDRSVKRPTDIKKSTQTHDLQLIYS